MYSEKVMDHFQHPRNVGEIENASGMGTVGNAKCGDIMRIYLDIDDNQIDRRRTANTVHACLHQNICNTHIILKHLAHRGCFCDFHDKFSFLFILAVSYAALRFSPPLQKHRDYSYAFLY